MRKMKRALGLIALALALVGTGRSTLAGEKLNIYTVNYPLAYFAERIAGDLAEVTFPVPPGVDPAFWMPDFEIIAGYQGADLILLNGADYAKWTGRVSLPRSRLVDTSRAFKDRYIEQPNQITHNHGLSGQHSHGGTAFTTWLDLDQAAQQAEAIAEALIRKRPEAKDRIGRNFQSLREELLKLDQQISETTRAHSSLPLLASHPVYQYLARRYGLDLRSVLWEPEEAPSEAQWAELKEILSEHPAKWMIWEDKPAQEIAARLRALGVKSVVVNPCSNRPAAGDFLTVMAENAKGLDRIFGRASDGP